MERLPFIEHVAVKITSTGEVFTLPKPKRHCDILKVLSKTAVKYKNNSIQGFYVDGKFLDRLDAATYALRSAQIKELQHPPYLYSEDLW